MATIETVIARVNNIRANTYTNEQKAGWLIGLDGRIYAEVHDALGEEPARSYPEDKDKELLAPSPYDALYDYYLFAMMDYFNRETENYHDSMALYDMAAQDYAAAYLRGHRPQSGGGFAHVMD